MCRLERLASLVVDVDELSDRIASRPLTEREASLLSLVIFHLYLSLDRLEQALYDHDRLDVTNKRK